MNMPPEIKIDCATKKHLSLNESNCYKEFAALGLRYLLFATRNHIASNLTKFMATYIVTNIPQS
jgi:hypothetical protein